MKTPVAERLAQLLREMPGTLRPEEDEDSFDARARWLVSHGVEITQGVA